MTADNERALIERFVVARASCDCDALRELTAYSITEHTRFAATTSIGQDEFLVHEGWFHELAPFRSIRIADISGAPFGWLVRTVDEYTELATGKRHKVEEISAMRIVGDRIAEIWLCSVNMSGKNWKKYKSPSWYDMRYIGGWPGLDEPTSVRIGVKDGILSLHNIPDYAFSAAGRALVQTSIGAVVACSLGEWRDVQHHASTGDVLWGTLGGYLAGRLVSRDDDLVHVLGAGAGARGAASTGHWTERLTRIALVVEQPESDPFAFILEEMPFDRRVQGSSSSYATTLWQALQQQRLKYGESPLASMLAYPRGDDVLVEAVRPESGSPARADGEGGDPAVTSAGTGTEALEQLERLASLHEAGALTAAEFGAAKSTLLRRI